MSDRTDPRPGRRPGDVRVGCPAAGAKLPRTLGAPALFAACYGNVGSSIYYALGVTAAFALGLTPAGPDPGRGIFVTTALNYAEGTAAIPHAGGSSSFARRAFNAPIGFLVGWIQLLNYTATVSISAYFAIGYLGVFGQYVSFFKILHDPYWHAAAAVTLTGILMVVNVIGIQESSAINFFLALLDLGHAVRAGASWALPAAQHQHRHPQHPLGRGADLGQVPGQHLDRDGELHRHRNHLQHVRRRPSRRDAPCRARPGASSAPCSSSPPFCPRSA